jgi:transcription elongation factor
MNEEDKLIQEQFQKLPPELQQAINAVPWKAAVKEVASSNNLTQEKAEILERETMFILYGFENPDDYIKNMMREVQINEEIAAKIAGEVNEKVFKVIAEQMDKAQAPQAIHNNLPMVEPGETVHDVSPAVDSKQQIVDSEKPQVSTPDYRYPGGADPYREPME